jgi:hypothetical protein
VEVYSKLYYPDRVASAVADRINVLGERPSIRMIREVTKEMYEGEEEEIKAAVVAKMEATAKVTMDDDHDGDACTPQQYQE